MSEYWRSVKIIKTAKYITMQNEQEITNKYRYISQELTNAIKRMEETEDAETKTHIWENIQELSLRKGHLRRQVKDASN